MPVRQEVRIGQRVSVPVPVSIPVRVSAPAPYNVPVAVPVTVPVRVPQAFNVPVRVPVPMAVPMRVTSRQDVPYNVPVTVPVPVPIPLIRYVIVDTPFEQRYDVAVPVGMHVGVSVGVLVPVSIPMINKDTAKAAFSFLDWMLATCQNVNFMPLIPTVIEGLVDVNKSTETVEGLAETVFIQTVDTPPLTVIASILTSDLPQKSQSATKRAYIRIIENMSKLVEEPRNLINFIALWPPKFESNHDNLSDPEYHEICKVTHDVFIRKTDVSRSKTTSSTTL